MARNLKEYSSSDSEFNGGSEGYDACLNDSSYESDASNASVSETSSSDDEDDSNSINKEANYVSLPEDISTLNLNTFSLTERDPETLFALSYDVAFKVGLRDSASLFNRYPLLTRLWTTDAEREYLVSIKALSANVMRKNIGVVDLRQLIAIIGLDPFLASDSTHDITGSHNNNDGDDRIKSKRYKKQSKPSALLSQSQIQSELESKLDETQRTQLYQCCNDEISLNCLLEAGQFNSRIHAVKLTLPKSVPVFVKEMTVAERAHLNQLLIENQIDSLPADINNENLLRSTEAISTSLNDKAVKEKLSNSVISNVGRVRECVKRCKLGIPSFSLN